MKDPVDELKKLAAILRAEIVAHVYAAVESATGCFNLDDYTDNAVYGYYFYRNVTNRLIAAAANGEISLALVGNGNDRAFGLMGCTLRVHRVDAGTLLPRGAEAARLAARVASGGTGMLSLFPDQIVMGSNLIVGVVCGPIQGLQRVIVGEMVQWAGSDTYGYAIPPVEVFNPYRERSGEEEGQEVPPEVVPTPIVTLKDAPEEGPVDGDVRVRNDDKNQDATNA